ncbi:MAG: DUF4431 domain-containing protein [Xanthomonadaceae bacterium]|nr:DUF4431 domain-containing protein [Xanthomonadaceae bacterium]
MKRIWVNLLSLMLLCAWPAIATEPVYSYQPAWVTIEGTLHSISGTTAEGIRYSFPAILLDRPITVRSASGESASQPTEQGISLVQLVLNDRMAVEFTRLKGMRVRVVGTFSHGSREQHRTRLLLTPTSIVRLKESGEPEVGW